MTRSISTRAVALLLLVLGAAIGGAAACGPVDDLDDGEPIETTDQAVKAPLAQAYCKIKVEGKGEKDTETDYLPNVINCENGGADLQALKAQAIAARSVAYYNMATKGSICDSQGCQVYSCGRTPSAKAIQAVNETKGMYLSYASMLTYGFYVDGDHTPSAETCKGRTGQPREKYVTYNDGKTGNNVQQTTLGWVGPPGFGQNRGCMAQWGARCLEKKGRDYRGILKFYYGDDIQILTATGPCTSATPPPDPPPEPPPQNSTDLQPMTRAEIIGNAKTGVGYSYWWGHGRWDPSSKAYPGQCTGSCPSCTHKASPSGGPEYGADCSGYAAQVWQVPNPNPFTKDRHPYSTYNFRCQTTHWDPIPRADLKQGDAMVRRSNTCGTSGGAGHIFIFDKWAADGKAYAYECVGCAQGCVYGARSVGTDYIAIRRRKVNDVEAKKPPEGFLDKVSCENGVEGWAWDPNNKDVAADVLIGFDSPSGIVGRFAKADQHREDLCTAIGSCNHGFKLPIPEEARDGTAKSVYVWVRDEASAGGWKLLIGAPKTLTCQPSTPPCAHDKCATGVALDASCDPCVKQVCDYDPWCCKYSWDSLCQLEVDEICGAGSCPPPDPLNCFQGNTCQSGQICSWNGLEKGYCCKASWTGSQKCFSDWNCAPGICSEGAEEIFYCTQPDAQPCL
jgi:hypothetical protein